jgi:hypothetical protein
VVAIAEDIACNPSRDRQAEANSSQLHFADVAAGTVSDFAGLVVGQARGPDSGRLITNFRDVCDQSARGVSHRHAELWPAVLQAKHPSSSER